MVIPALAPTLDKSLKGDSSLCRVRPLHYYLDRTSDIRQNKELVFVSFKKVLIRPSHLPLSPQGSSRLILCYELSDQEALTMHQVKAHDVRAFAASKACHWKSHNTFTQFSLKDVAWADSEFFIWAQWWLLNRSTTNPKNEELYRYVLLYILYILCIYISIGPAISLLGVYIGLDKRCYDVTVSRQEGSTMRHLVNAHPVTSPAGSLYRTAFSVALTGKAIVHWIGY